MKTINDIISEGKRTEYKLGDKRVVKGQEITIKSPWDASKTMNVFYLKPHENEGKFFYCVDVNGKQCAFKIDDIVDIVSLPKPLEPAVSKKSGGKRAMSWEQRNNLCTELDDLRAQYRELMMDQEEQAADVMRRWVEDGKPEQTVVDAPNYDKEWLSMWKQIDKISAKISKIEDKLESTAVNI